MRIVMKKILVYIPFLVCIGGCIGNKECKEFPQDAVGYMVSSILQTKEISFPSYYIVKDMLGKACRIDSIFAKPCLVLRFGELNCESCIKSSIEMIRESKIGNHIIGLASYNNMRMLHLAQKKYGISFPVYYVPMNDSDMLSVQHEKRGNPYLFLLDRDLKGRYFFSPSLQYPEILKEYLEQTFVMLEEKRRGEIDIFCEKNKDLGTVVKGQKYEIEFVYTNTTDDLLVINDVKTSCGCLISQWRKELLSSGKTSSLMVEFTPESLGYTSKTIVVSHNQSNIPIRLKIKANVVDNMDD